ncbi:C40 family peptidase [Levilactobacillus namurensis]|uniref:C40 family peptidase n=1 Tax=Levilactobacillus namurensis TaxID=380393 RepID=UPI00222FB16D|nr:C40 family peptidase [Levilactobacillus namurensis]MCW3778156.1 NlpC/P60 family protein [Levilactobacillus namurensis]MDT7018086.1 NlpC/P60 family protein [Levilactobacillus namurensis]WNN64924.1 NlpC/P60 family protein [Levilactobacillus namurensis]
MAGSQTAQASTVNVQAGDTVWGFSQTHHVSIQDIVKANRLSDANLIYINQKLVIPDGQTTAKQSQKSATTTAAAPAKSTAQATTPKQSTASAASSAQTQQSSSASAKQQSSATTTAKRQSSAAATQSSTTASTTASVATKHHTATTNAGTQSQANATTGTTNSTTSGATQSSTSSTTSTPSASTGGGVATALKIANSNVPYVYGGSSMAGFDCSGLVQYALGLSARTTYQQTKLGTHHYDVANAPAGAILFWGSESAPYHDGISLGNGQYVAAQNPTDGIGVFSQSAWQPSYYIIP